jgi:hypothetical protein
MGVFHVGKHIVVSQDDVKKDGQEKSLLIERKSSELMASS